MNQVLTSKLETLRQFNLWVRRQLELAEATIPILNDQIGQLARMGLLIDDAVLGDVIYKRAYTDANPGSLLLQAALLIPGGFGLIEWDAEEYLDAERSRSISAADARIRFRRFDELEPGFKALLLPQVDYLFGRLLAAAFPRRPDPPPTITSWTTKPT